jgi:hypothetical protein
MRSGLRPPGLRPHPAPRKIVAGRGDCGRINLSGALDVACAQTLSARFSRPISVHAIHGVHKTGGYFKKMNDYGYLKEKLFIAIERLALGEKDIRSRIASAYYAMATLFLLNLLKIGIYSYTKLVKKKNYARSMVY